MILHTIEVKALPDYRPFLRFNNGAAGEVDLRDELEGGNIRRTERPGPICHRVSAPRDENRGVGQRAQSRTNGDLELMSSEAITQTHQAAGIIPAAPWRVRALSVLPEWQLAVSFNDGLSGIVDVSALVNGAAAGVFEALRAPTFFATAYLDCGAVAWPNGADLAPDAMHKEICRCGVWRILD